MGSANAHVHPHNTLAYAGEVTAREAWERLAQDKDAVLIDVRTPPEWTFAGEADLSSLGKRALKISWKLFPTFAVNDQFMASLKSAGIPASAPIFFLCRTGGRSLDAAIAATAEGYQHAYNITDGFEGPLDNASHQRGRLAGWKAANLPWGQS